MVQFSSSFPGCCVDPLASERDRPARAVAYDVTHVTQACQALVIFIPKPKAGAMTLNKILTSQVVCIRHKANKDGYLLPKTAVLLRFNFLPNLQEIIFEKSSRPDPCKPATYDQLFENTKQIKVPFSFFTDACLGFYSPHGKDAQQVLDESSLIGGVDPEKSLTLYFFHIKPIYIEMQSKEMAVQYLEALLLLKAYPDLASFERICDREQYLEALLMLKAYPDLASFERICDQLYSPPTSQHQMHLKPKVKVDTPRLDKVLSFRDRESTPEYVVLDWDQISNTITIKPRGGERERYPVAEISSIGGGGQSEIFGMTKWVLSIHFKDSKYRSLHLGLLNHDDLKDLLYSLRTTFAKSLSGDHKSHRTAQVDEQQHALSKQKIVNECTSRKQKIVNEHEHALRKVNAGCKYSPRKRIFLNEGGSSEHKLANEEAASFHKQPIFNEPTLLIKQNFVRFCCTTPRNELSTISESPPSTPQLLAHCPKLERADSDSTIIESPPITAEKKQLHRLQQADTDLQVAKEIWNVDADLPQTKETSLSKEKSQQETSEYAPQTSSRKTGRHWRMDWRTALFRWKGKKDEYKAV
eukprot:g30237.t1